MANSYCRFLSNGFRFIDNSGIKYQPCCWVPLSSTVSGSEHLTRVRKDITEKVLANKEKYCHDCINKEQAGYATSLRLLSFNQIPQDVDDGLVVDLSIQIDNTCNAACSICHPGFSSLWAKEINPAFKIENAEHKFHKLVKMLDLSKLETIRFYGGEPLVNDNHLILLNAIANPENVSISYSTNGSIFPNDSTIDVWKKFKKIDIVFSIDGVDDVFHYIRWPLSWNKVMNNIVNFSKLDCITKIGFNYTVNPMNAWYYDKFEAWFNTLDNTLEKYRQPSISVCYGSWGTEATPQILRNKIYEKYGNDHKITKLLKSFPVVEEKWNGLLYIMRDLDKKRKISHSNTFAEVFKIIK